MDSASTDPPVVESAASPAPEEVGSSSRGPELVAAAFVLALGLGAFFGALDLGYWAHGPGPGFFPLWLGVLLMLMAVIWGVQVARGRNVHQPEPVAAGGRRAVALVLGALLVAVLLLDVIGYQLAMAVLVLFLLLVIAGRRLIESVVVALLASFGIYAMFANVLQVYLPTASVPFLAQLGL